MGLHETRFCRASLSSLVTVSLVLSYVIMALCLAPIACLLCCSLLILAVRVAAKSS